MSAALVKELRERTGLGLLECKKALAKADGNIERINVEEQNAKFSVVSLVLHVSGRKHLARVMRRIRTIRAVTHISRVRH